MIHRNSLFMAVALEYTTVDDLLLIMTQVDLAETTDDTSADESEIVQDTSKLKQHLEIAEARVNSYLHRYERPIDPVPPTVKYAVLILARYQLHERTDGDVGEGIQESYDQIVTWLQAVANEEADLGVSEFEEYAEEVGFGDRNTMQIGTLPFIDKSGIFPEANT